MQVVETAKIPWELVSKSNRPGRVHRKLVHEGIVSPGVGYTADLVRYEGGNGTFTAPRHKHNFDQIRYTISGTPDFGHYQVSAAGQSAFFPAGAAYGPETIEEADVLLIQWGTDWVSRAQHDATYAEMQKVGEFREGFYITTDADGNEQRADGRNAVWEAFNGRKLEYPTPRYPQPVMMAPEGFRWRAAENAAGVSQKVLGRFTEDDVYLANYRWDRDDGSLVLPSERLQLVWVGRGQITVHEVRYEPATVIFCEYGETVPLSATAGTEIVVFGLALPVGVTDPVSARPERVR
jgi:hypothetical protein